MSPPVFRFAPSPNGYLHLGHALSALLNVEAARAAGGRFLLRIEDIDTLRCRPEFEAAIYEDLAWLGIEWERPVRRQSEHLAEYKAALDTLDAQGMLYPSFASRAAILRQVAAHELKDGTTWPRDPDGAPVFSRETNSISDEERRRMATGDPYTLRLDMPAALARVPSLSWTEIGAGGETGTVVARPEMWGDVILGRKEFPASYHLSVVIDDALQGVTHVVRGTDLYRSTDVHRLLQVLLGLPAPIYRHHRLILDEDGRKLSKSTQATALRALRSEGKTPDDIRRMIGLDVSA